MARELAEAGVAVDACVGSATAAKLVGVEDFEALGAGEVCVATMQGACMCGPVFDATKVVVW